MRPAPFFVVVLLGPLTGSTLAQAPPEPPALRLPMGSRARLRPVAAPGGWIRGTLVGADSVNIALLPENAPPVIGSELRLPRETVAQLELLTSRKKHWLHNLVMGLAAGVAMGFSFDVDAVRCEFDSDYFCSCGEAVALGGFAFGAIGVAVGALVKTDVWTRYTQSGIVAIPSDVKGHPGSPAARAARTTACTGWRLLATP
jgi:hypothetical protein